MFHYLVLELKIDTPREHIDECVEAVEVDERLAVVVHAEHHLEAPHHAIEILVIL